MYSVEEYILSSSSSAQVPYQYNITDCFSISLVLDGRNSCLQHDRALLCYFVELSHIHTLSLPQFTACDTTIWFCTLGFRQTDYCTTRHLSLLVCCKCGANIQVEASKNTPTATNKSCSCSRCQQTGYLGVPDKGAVLHRNKCQFDLPNTLPKPTVTICTHLGKHVQAVWMQ